MSIKNKMKLLIISPYPLFPTQYGGKIRIVKIARHLCDLGVEVTIVTPFHFTQKRELYQHEKFTLHQVYYPFVLPFLLTDKPFPYTYLSSFHLGLATLLKGFFSDFDVYQFEHVQFAQMLDCFDKSHIITYDAHNVEYDYARSECAQAWVKNIAGKRLHRLEKQLVDGAAHTFAMSETDATRLQALYSLGDNFSISPNGMKSLAELSRGDGKQMARRFPELKQFSQRAIYSGSDVVHNHVSVRFILEQLAPQLSEYAFIIHGTCGKPFAATSSASNVFFDFDDANFSDYAVDGTLALNPVNQGSGTNLKVINYLSYGMPTLSTPFGLRGYEGLQDYVLVGELTDFVDLLRQGDFITPPEAAVLEKDYSWRSIAENMHQVYCQLITQAASDTEINRT